MDPVQLPLYIDPRDGSKNLLQYPCIADIAEPTFLPAGDAMIVGNGPEDTVISVGVEIKSVHDLVSSINTGRLQDTQLRGLIRDFGHDAGQMWLLWFGSVRAGEDGRLEIRRRKRGKSGREDWQTFRLGPREVPYAYLASQLFDLSAEGVRIAHVYDEAEAAVWLYCLHRWWSKPWSAHKGLHVLDSSRSMPLLPSMDDDFKLRVKVAAQLPGVGFERAVAAAGYFGSVEAMCTASAEEWAEIPGIGKVIAKAVTSAIRS